MEKIKFKNLVDILKFYFQNIYEKQDKADLKPYKINYLNSNINLQLPQFLIEYINKNKSRLIKNTINNSYQYCYRCDDEIKVSKEELITINKEHSLFEIVKESYNDIIDNSVVYIGICSLCMEKTNSSCSSSDKSLEEDDYESDSYI